LLGNKLDNDPSFVEFWGYFRFRFGTILEF